MQRLKPLQGDPKGPLCCYCEGEARVMVETPNTGGAKALRRLGGELHIGVGTAQGRHLRYR